MAVVQVAIPLCAAEYTSGAARLAEPKADWKEMAAAPCLVRVENSLVPVRIEAAVEIATGDWAQHAAAPLAVAYNPVSAWTGAKAEAGARDWVQNNLVPAAAVEAAGHNMLHQHPAVVLLAAQAGKTDYGTTPH